MLATITPSALSGSIWAPASKSSMQRACAAAFLRKGRTIIHHPGHSHDDKAAVGGIRDLGAQVTPLDGGDLMIQPPLPGKTRGASQVNCGESGLGMRMFA